MGTHIINHRKHNVTFNVKGQGLSANALFNHKVHKSILTPYVRGSRLTGHKWAGFHPGVQLYPKVPWSNIRTEYVRESPIGHN